MSKKSNLSSLAEAGVSIIAKLKKRSNDKIIPQSYVYEEKPRECVRSVVDKVNGANSEYKRNEEKYTKYEEAPKEAEELTEETAENAERQAQEAFSQFQAISAKLESMKKSLHDLIANSENKKNELLGAGLKKEDLQKELDKTVLEIEEKLNAIKGTMDKTGDYVAEIIAACDEETKNQYSKITEGIQSVSESAEKTGQKIESIEGALNEARQKVGEIHQTTASIDKLYDSVFELKTASINTKTEIEELKVRQSKQARITLILLSITGLISLATLAASILK